MIDYLTDMVICATRTALSDLKTKLATSEAARAESSAQWQKWMEAHDRVKAERDAAIRQRDEAYALLSTLGHVMEERS